MKFNKGFFDSREQSKFKLWRHLAKEKVDEEPLLLNSTFYKRSKKGTKLAEREFFLTKKFLYYKKSQDDSKIRGVMMLKNVRLEYSIPQGYTYPKIDSSHEHAESLN